jgi:flagellar FliL protein
MPPDTPSPSDDVAPESSGLSSPAYKVELDLEDAPFLDEKEEAPPLKRKAAPTGGELPAGEKKASALKGKWSALLANKKRLVLIGGAVLFLLLAPVALMLFFSGEKKPPPQTPEVITQPAAPPRPDAPPGPKFLFKAESFLVELRGSEGEIRFLRFRFSIPTENQALYAELMAKNIALRDAIYYYLSNKPLTFLVDAQAHETLKQDVISVVNEHVSSEKIQDLYIEDYYVTGRESAQKKDRP